MRKSTLEKLADLKRGKFEQRAMTLEELMLLLLDPRPEGKRQAEPTQRAFIFDPHPFKAYMGRKGSAKTSSGCAGGWLRSLLQPGSKGLVARADYNDLKQTTALRMQEMLQRLPKGILLDRSKDPPMNWVVQAVPTLSPEGDIIDDTPSQITFMGLNSMEEGGSYEFDWGFIDEASECEMRSVVAVNGLMRNMPKSWPTGETRFCTMLTFNPTDQFHWLYTACTGLDHSGRRVREPWLKLFTPIKGENQRNLPADYYQRLAATMPEDMKVRLIEGDWGIVHEGAPVYREFKKTFHGKQGLMQQYDRSQTLYRFWDFGYRHPYVCWSQEDAQGRLLTMKELVLTNLEIEPFVREVKAFQQKHFPNHRDVRDIGDPAARQKKDTGSTLQELLKHGIQLLYKIATIEHGIRVIRTRLEQVVDAEPMLQVDTEGAPILCAALNGGYHLDEHGQKPVKDGYYDHPADGYRYGIDYLYGGGVSDEMLTDMPLSLEYQPNLDNYGRGY